MGLASLEITNVAEENQFELLPCLRRYGKRAKAKIVWVCGHTAATQHFSSFHKLSSFQDQVLLECSQQSCAQR